MAVDYNDVRNQQRDLHRKYAQLKQDKQKTVEEINSIRSRKSNEEQVFQRKLESSKADGFKEHQREVVKPFEDKLNIINDKIEEITEKHKVALDEITEENVSKEFEGEQDAYSKIQEALDDVNISLDKVLGVRFKETLQSQLESQELKLEQEDLDEFTEYFNQLNERLHKLAKFNDNPVIESFTKKISSAGSTRLANNSTNLILVAALFIGLTIAFTYKVLPFYVIGLLLLLIFCIYRSYLYYEVIISYKAVQENLDSIQHAMDNKVAKEIERRTKKENQKYDRQMQILKEKRDKVNSIIEGKIAESSRTYNFDDTEIKRDYKAFTDSIDEQEKKLQNKLTELDTQMEQVLSDEREKQSTLKQIAEDIPKQLLNPAKIGSDYLFNGKILLDMVDLKPVYFEHPGKSCLFIYTDVNDVTKFIRLMLFQLRGKINPFLLNMAVVDVKQRGINYLNFKAEKYPELFGIYSNAEEINKLLEDLSSLTLKRISQINRVASNIAEYNQFMISTESVPESYQFYFFIDPDQTVLNSTSFRQCCAIGGDIGIYMHMFIKKDVFYKMSDTARDLVESTECFYVLQNEKCQQRGKDYVLENLIKGEN